MVRLSFGGSSERDEAEWRVIWSATLTLDVGLHLFYRESLLRRSGTYKASLVNHCCFTG